MTSPRAAFSFLARLGVVLLCLALLDCLAPEAQAFSLRSYFSGMATRSRVIQICVITMGIALLIMLKKFAPSDPEVPRSRRS